jgi:hypothetical protein
MKSFSLAFLFPQGYSSPIVIHRCVSATFGCAARGERHANVGRIEKGARISDQCFPVLGLRPADATVLDRKSPEAAQFNAIFPGEHCHDLTQNGVDDILYIALVEVGILRCKHSRGRSL